MCDGNCVSCAVACEEMFLLTPEAEAWLLENRSEMVAAGADPELLYWAWMDAQDERYTTLI